MKLNIDWREMIRAIAKAALPFLSGALAGFLTGCSFNGSGIGMTL